MPLNPILKGSLKTTKFCDISLSLYVAWPKRILLTITVIGEGTEVREARETPAYSGRDRS